MKKSIDQLQRGDRVELADGRVAEIARIERTYLFDGPHYEVHWRVDGLLGSGIHHGKDTVAIAKEQVA